MSSPSGFAEVDPFTQQSSPASSRADDEDFAGQQAVDRPPSPPPPAERRTLSSSPRPAEQPSTSARAEASSSQAPYSRAYNLQQAEYAQASIARYLQGDTFTIEVRSLPSAAARISGQGLAQPQPD